ncbi:MAG: major capsid protein [Microviridae sp.]|nr:MAG: major capsid protein [Microviridae sp.]
MRNQSPNQHNFALVPTLSKPRSVFDRSQSYKTTLDADYLYPYYFPLCYPGDGIKASQNILVRFNSPLLFAPLDNLWLDTFTFFVPIRLVWTNFVKFMGEQTNPGDSISYTVPQCTGPNVASGGIALGSLMDYFGLPTEAQSGGGATTGITYNNLLPRCYQLIWNTWFRDENLQNSVTVDLGDGPDTYTNYNLLRRGKRFDYFTSCLPYPQKDSTAISMPLAGSAPVTLTAGAAGDISIQNSSGSPIKMGSSGTYVDVTGTAGSSANALYANLASATGATITAMRQSVALQQFLENDARGGVRYTEILKHRWGVNQPDKSWRPELVHTSSVPIKLNVVASTVGAAADPAYPLGALGSFGTAVNSPSFTYQVTEHGYLISLLSIRADIAYAQGMDRSWSYRTRYDFYNPDLEGLSEQAVLNREIYTNIADGTGATQKDGVFGYQEYHAEDRFGRSMVTGLMRPQATGTLAAWNFVELFSSQPTLGSTFIPSSATTPIDRAISFPSQPQFLVDVYTQAKWARVMPVYSVPGLKKL